MEGAGPNQVSPTSESSSEDVVPSFERALRKDFAKKETLTFAPSQSSLRATEGSDCLHPGDLLRNGRF